MSDLISVIIPVYNVEQYLRQAVESVLTQTYQNLEIILVNDGSTDSSPEICEEYARKDARVKVLHKANGGLSSARNFGMDNMHGKYFMFVDSDDTIMPETAEMLYRTTKETAADISMCGMLHQRKHKRVQAFCGNFIVSDKKTLYDLMLLHKISRSACAKLFSADKYALLRFENGIIYEDVEFMSRYLAVTDKLAAVDYPGYVYYMRNNSIVHVKLSKNTFDFMNIVEKVRKILDSESSDYNNEFQAFQLESYLVILKVAIISNAYRNLFEECKVMADWIKQNLLSILRNKYISHNNKIGALLFALDNDWLLNLLAKYLIMKRDCI